MSRLSPLHELETEAGARLGDLSPQPPSPDRRGGQGGEVGDDSSQSPSPGRRGGQKGEVGDDSGWRMPADFGDILSEYRAAREQAVMIDVSHRTKIELRGRDHVAFLQNFCTNDVAKLAEWQGCEAFLTTAQAKIVAHLRIFKQPESLWLDASPGLGGKITQYLERYHIIEDVEILDRTENFAQLHLTGPDVAELLARSTRSDIPRAELTRMTVNIANTSCRLARNDLLGQCGYDLVWPVDSGPAVARQLMEAGFRFAGLAAYEILRVEAGTPEYGQDIDDGNLPQEVGRDDRAISFTKGCYVGQETVARIRAYGHVNRRLAGLRLEHSVAVPRGTRLFHQDHEIGKITSSVVSPRFGAIALGYVRREQQAVGTRVEVEAGHQRLPATISPLPFA